jgi:hypothetical protein
VPHLPGVELLVNPSVDPTTAERGIKQVQAVAEHLRMSFQFVEAGQPDQIERAFPSNSNVINGVMVCPDGMCRH